jgi:hypothetical protein
MNSKFRFLYLRDGKRFPVACISYHFDPETSTVLYGVSTINPLDRFSFNREVARSLAAGRLALEQKKAYLSLDAGANNNEVMFCLLDYLERHDKTLPTRARKAIKLWLSKVVRASIGVKDLQFLVRDFAEVS